MLQTEPHSRLRSLFDLQSFRPMTLWRKKEMIDRMRTSRLRRGGLSRLGWEKRESKTEERIQNRRENSKQKKKEGRSKREKVWYGDGREREREERAYVMIGKSSNWSGRSNQDQSLKTSLGSNKVNGDLWWVCLSIRPSSALVDGCVEKKRNVKWVIWSGWSIEWLVSRKSQIWMMMIWFKVVTQWMITMTVRQLLIKKKSK